MNDIQPQDNTNIPEELSETVPAVSGLEPTEVSEEKKETELSIEELQLRPQFELFLKLYTDPGTKENPNKLFGNATQCAIEAYQLEVPRQYNYAKSLGHRLVTSNNHVARKILEKRGLHYAGMLNIAANKVMSTDNPRWWDIVAEHQGYNKDVKATVQVTNNQLNMFNLDSKEVKDFNKDFAKFLENQ
jgi:hypothetical protein